MNSAWSKYINDSDWKKLIGVYEANYPDYLIETKLKERFRDVNSPEIKAFSAIFSPWEPFVNIKKTWVAR